MKTFIILFSFLFVCLSFPVLGQYNMDEKVPLDPKTKIGKLKNGMTYYIRQNSEPKERASFYIIQNVGALLEEDHQNGLAHFLEHMAFKGTKHFPGNSIIDNLASHGVAFGKNLNAYTSQEETVYNISDVPTTDEKLLDTCLLILHDWSNYLLLQDTMIDKERGVISEEWRTRRNSYFRISSQITPVLYKGAMHAKRDVIGDLDIIQNFPYQDIKDFYHDWYRTDLQAIAIVGDFDPVEMEKKVKKLFAKIPAVKKAAPRPFFEIPEHDETYYVLATDKEAQNTSISIYTLIKDEKYPNNTQGDIRDNMITNLYNAMIRARISELVQKGEPPFINASIYYTGMARGYKAYIMTATAHPYKEDVALRGLLAENERIKRFGFTETELERTKTNVLTSLESSYKQKDKLKNEYFINQIKSHYLTQYPMMDMDFYYDFVKTILPTITVEEISAKAKEWDTNKNRTIAISGPSDNTTYLSEAEANMIIKQMANATGITPYEDVIVESNLIKKDLSGGKIVSVRPIEELGAEEWTLSNGAKILYRKADYEKDQVTLLAQSAGGSSLYDNPEDLPSVYMLANMVRSYGLSEFDNITLTKMLTGKKVSYGVGLNSLYETFTGRSTPTDLETLFQLLYLSFEEPRFDKEAHETFMIRQKANIANISSNPNQIINDSLSRIRTNYHPRTLLFNEEYLNNVDIAKIEEVYRDRFKDASDFVFIIVGNVEKEDLTPLVEKYIGSISSYDRKESWKDNMVRNPKKSERIIEVPMETEKATCFTEYVQNNISYTPQHSIYLQVVREVLKLRYTENIREKEGGTYGVQVGSSVSKFPYEKFTLTMRFDCERDRAEHLQSLIHKEAEVLAKEGPTAEELEKVVLNMKKEREQSKPHNAYWLNALYTYYLLGYNSTDPANYENILEKITTNDIKNFASSFFKNADEIDVIFKSTKK